MKASYRSAISDIVACDVKLTAVPPPPPLRDDDETREAVVARAERINLIFGITDEGADEGVYADISGG